MPKIPISEETRQQMLAAHNAGKMQAAQSAAGQAMPTDLSQAHELKAHLISAHDWDDSLFWRNSHEDRHPQLGASGGDDRELTHTELRRVHDNHDHVVYRNDFPKSVTLGHNHFHEA